MKSPSEERGLFSRLPDDREYWNGLSARIVSDAAPTLVAYRDDQGEWWTVLARFSTALAVGATAAVVAALMLIPSSDAGESRSSTRDAYGLAPTGTLAAPLISAEAPPAMETLMVLRTGERGQ